MKTITTAMMLGAAVLFGPVAQAHDEHIGGNEDLYQSPLADHGPGGRSGPGQKGEGDFYASHLENPEDVRPDPMAVPDRPRGRDPLHEQDPEGYGFN